MAENEDGTTTYIVLVAGRKPVKVVADEAKYLVMSEDNRFQVIDFIRDGKRVALFASVEAYWRDDAASWGSYR